MAPIGFTDVMDNLLYRTNHRPTICEAIRPYYWTHYDVHLMVEPVDSLT